MMGRSYIPLPIRCDVAECTIVDAILHIDKTIGRIRWNYELHVSTNKLASAKRLLQELAAKYLNNPLAPYINLIEEPNFDTEEWCIVAVSLLNPLNIAAVGSEGA